MRRLIIAALFGIAASSGLGCSNEPGELRMPPQLHVTSPERSLRMGKPGEIMVSGVAKPNQDSGEAITAVLVNGVNATVASDGHFRATIDVEFGPSLIHTIARDASGMEESDTRSVQVGEVRGVGTSVADGVIAAISKPAFAALGTAASNLLATGDLAAMLETMQPMAHRGDENGPDCSYARVYVDDLDIADAEIRLEPVEGGLSFYARIDGLDVPTRMEYRLACIPGDKAFRALADSVLVEGILEFRPDGTNGIVLALRDERVELANLRFDDNGILELLGKLDLLGMFDGIMSRIATRVMEPLVSRALGDLDAPRTLELLGKQIDTRVTLTESSVDTGGAQIALDTMFLVQGSEDGPGWVYTPNGAPFIDAGDGFQFALSDDLLNQMFAELTAAGMLDLTQTVSGAAFDETKLEMTLPPMIQADQAGGKLRVVLGDVMATYSSNHRPVAKAALNISIDLLVSPGSDAQTVTLELVDPSFHVDVLDDIANTSKMTDADLARVTEIGISAQIVALTATLDTTPIPSFMGLQLVDVSAYGDNGYVMLTGMIE